MSNRVIAGKYENCTISIFQNVLNINLPKKSLFDLGTMIPLNKRNVLKYEILSNEVSTQSAAKRSLVGGFLFGEVGAIAGAASSSENIYRVSIQFKSGDKSLIEMDSRCFKQLQKQLY